MRPLDSTSQWSAVNPNFDVESDEEMVSPQTQDYRYLTLSLYLIIILENKTK